MSGDRTYFHVTTRPHAPRRAWHALIPALSALTTVGLCGFTPRGSVETADRMPPDGHACGNCTRIVLARTDVES